MYLKSIVAALFSSMITITTFAQPASAPVQTTPTAQTPVAPAAPAIQSLSRIAQTKTILIGVREASVPFSYQDEKKQPIGYAVDLCLKIADEIRTELKQRDIKHSFVTLASADRIPALLEGRVDLECGSTTNTNERQKKVDFSFAYYVTGARVLSRKKDKITDLKDLGGKVVAVTKGTTGERLVNAMNDKELHTLKVITMDNNDASFQAVETGKASAFVTDDILLFGLIAKSANRDTYEVVGKYISIEPYAIMMRKGDDSFKQVVNRTLARLYASGEIERIYAKWFENEERRIPMSRFLKEMIVQPNTTAAYP